MYPVHAMFCEYHIIAFSLLLRRLYVAKDTQSDKKYAHCEKTPNHFDNYRYAIAVRPFKKEFQFVCYFAFTIFKLNFSIETDL